MTVSPSLLAILACPVDKGPLLYLPDEAVLVNPRTHVAYDVRDGIPVMLVEESRRLDDAEFGRLMDLVAAEGIEPTFEQ